MQSGIYQASAVLRSVCDRWPFRRPNAWPLAWTLAIALAMGLAGCRQRDRESSPESPASSATTAAFEPSAELIERHNRAVALMGHFDYAAAHDELAPLVEAHPQWLDGKVDLAIVTLNRRQTGDSEKAVALLREVLDRDPEHLRAHYCLGILRLDGGDPEAARDLFAKVADRDPDDAYATYYTGQCEFQLGNVAESLARYEKALARDPYLRSCYYGAFQASLRLGQEQAADQYRQVFEQLNGNPQARLAEIKYTRMGPKAELQTLDVPAPNNLIRPRGALFAEATSIKDCDGREIPWTVSLAESVNVTAVRWGDGGRLLFLANASRDATRPHVLLEQTADGLRWIPDHPLASVAAVQESETPRVRAVAWGDYDNDGLVDVYFACRGPNALWRQIAPGEWRDVTESTGTSGGDLDTQDVQFFDADHDGDLDLFLANHGPNELLSNNLDGTFRSIAEERGLTGGERETRSVAVLDIDADRDLDLFVVHSEGPPELFLNNRLWDYETVATDAAFAHLTLLGAVPFDREVDGRVELVCATSDGLKLVRFGPDRAWAIDSVPSTDLDPPSGDSAQGRDPGLISVLDLDGDGELDLFIADESGWRVLDMGTGQANQQTETTPIAAARLLQLGGDAGLSLLTFTLDGPQLYLPGPGRFRFVELDFTGKDEQADQMRSNRSGIGIDAAARVGTTWTSFRTLRSDSGPGQSLQPVAVGLKGYPRVDFVRMTWPDGVFQTEYDLAPGELHTVTETQRQVASCPVVFAWNGSRYEFVTDVLGVAGLGFNIGFGQYGEPRPWENLLLPEAALVPRDGRLLLTIGEPMEEVCYLDAARLVAYDLPPGWQMTVDERFAISEPAPTGAPVFYRKLLLPIDAINDRGESVLSEVRAADFVAAEPGSLDPRFLGRTATHSIVLEFDQPIDQGEPFLLFDGWVEYPYSQTMFAAWQAGASFDAPTIEAQDDTGAWLPVAIQFGYMAGMPRQSVMPLDRKRLPANARRIRVTTNHEIYWDRLAVLFAEPAPDVTRHDLKLLEANVAEVGFARRTTLAQRRPYYDYVRRDPLWDTRHPLGLYSEFGPALELVAQVDDALAVIGPGEEVQLAFTAPPEPTANFQRRYVLELNGWCKDMDLYTRDGETVGPLPESGELDSTRRQHRERLHRNNHTRLRGGP